MMSLINTNYNYLSTMGISESSPQVGLIVSVYYLGCAIGAVIFSRLADVYGRKAAMFGCLATASLGNLVMFFAGLGYNRGALAIMYTGRVVMGLGVGGVDSVVPVYSSELSADHARGKALAQEFQSNIFGLNMAFAINLGMTRYLGKQVCAADECSLAFASHSLCRMSGPGGSRSSSCKFIPYAWSPSSDGSQNLRGGFCLMVERMMRAIV